MTSSSNVSNLDELDEYASFLISIASEEEDSSPTEPNQESHQTDTDKNLEYILELISDSQIRIDKHWQEIEYLDRQLDDVLQSLNY